MRCHVGHPSTYWDPGTQRLWEGRISKEQLNGRLNSTHIFHEALNLLRDDIEGQGRRDVSLRGWKEEDTGQRQVTGFQILRSLRPTKREIIFISITSTPMGVMTVSKSSPRGLLNEVKRRTMIINQMAIIFKSCKRYKQRL